MLGIVAAARRRNNNNVARLGGVARSAAVARLSA